MGSNLDAPDDTLQGCVKEDGSLYSVEWYLSWQLGAMHAVLDGEFTATDLRAIAEHMDRENARFIVPFGAGLVYARRRDLVARAYARWDLAHRSGTLTAPDRAPTLAEIGEALYGDRWQRAMARALGVSARTVRYWAVGEYPVPKAAWSNLYARMMDRRAALANLCEHIPA